MAALYLGVLIPVILFAFAIVSSSGSYEGPGSEVSVGTWNAILFAVTLLAMVWILFVYIVNRPAGRPEPPGHRASGPAARSAAKGKSGQGVSFKVRDGAKKAGAEGSGVKVGGPASGAEPGGAHKEEVKATGGGEGPGKVAAAGKGGEEAAAGATGKKEVPAPTGPSTPMAASDVRERLGPTGSGEGVSLVNKRMLEFPPYEDRGIFCETFIPVDDEAVLKFRFKVADELHVRS